VVPSPTSADVWWMIGFMPAVGEMVRCIDGSWMTRPHHARNGGADVSVPLSRHEAHRIVYRAACAITRRRRAGRVRAQTTAVPASGRESMTWAFDFRS
jgi:hypothetical protein